MLQARLRAAGIFFSVVLALTLLRDSLYGDVAAWQLQVAGNLAIVICVFLLSAARTFQRRWLRVSEALIFGITTGLLAMRLYNAMLDAASRGDSVAVMAWSKNLIIASILLMISHALFIPGTWQRASRFAIGFSAFPGATVGLMLLIHPKLIPALGQVATAERIARDLGLLLTAGALAVYGTHILNALRLEAFGARRLNQYYLRQKIGDGGMGEVYLAEHRFLKRPCAIKLIRPERAGSAHALARFEHEVQAMARLSHPNIVEIYDYGSTADGRFYYVMEYLEGRTVEELTAFYGPIPAGRCIYLLRQACEALAEAHSAGLIHRDIKPANLFVARKGRHYDCVKLLDFGLVKQSSDGTGSTELSLSNVPIGTPQFMAPEQIESKGAVDFRTDLYGMGGVAYFMLTGRAAFEGENASAVMIAATRDPVVPPSQVVVGVPNDLEKVILRCLAKKPSDRYQSAQELEKALEACTDARHWSDEEATQWWQHLNTPKRHPA